MKRLLAAFAVLGVMICGGACATSGGAKSATDSFEYLRKWIGQDPVAITADNYYKQKPRPALWEDPRVRPNIIKAIGEERLKQLETGWYVDNPAVTLVEEVDGNIAFSACKPHSACSETAVLFIDLKNGGVQACWNSAWFNESGKSKRAVGGCMYRQQGDLKRMFEENAVK